jgi:uncharacterized protein YbjT (DUF2867 family)
MKILVTGATGFVGREIVARLARAGLRFRLLARGGAAGEAGRHLAARYGAEVRTANLLDPASLPPAFAEADAVIHLVGIISECGDQTFDNIHVRATRNVVGAARQAGARRFLHMSALGTRPAAVSRYHQTKWAAEEIVRRSGLDYTLFRPSLIYGPNDAFVNLFARIIRCSPVIPLLGNPRARFQPLPVETVAVAFVKALTEPRAAGQTYDLCGPEALTLAQILDAILAALRRNRLKLPVPPALARSQAALLEFIFPRLFRKPPPLNRDQLLMLDEGNTGDGSPANALFGLPATRFREGIAAYLGRPKPAG